MSITHFDNLLNLLPDAHIRLCSRDSWVEVARWGTLALAN